MSRIRPEIREYLTKNNLRWKERIDYSRETKGHFELYRGNRRVGLLRYYLNDFYPEKLTIRCFNDSKILFLHIISQYSSYPIKRVYLEKEGRNLSMKKFLSYVEHLGDEEIHHDLPSKKVSKKIKKERKYNVNRVKRQYDTDKLLSIDTKPRRIKR